MLYTTSRADQTYEPIAVVRDTTQGLLVEIRNTLEVGEEGEYMERGIEVIQFTVVEMYNREGIAQTKANPGDRVVLHVEPVLQSAEVNAILRRKNTI